MQSVTRVGVVLVSMLPRPVKVTDRKRGRMLPMIAEKKK